MTERSLNGRTAIVTGGARGLGRAMARAMAGAGASVILADVDGAAAKATAAEIVASGGAAQGLACDITVAADCERAVATAQAQGGLHILINNAALGQSHLEAAPGTKSTRFWEADREMWQRIAATNINGTFLMSHTAAPAMIAQGWGRIINITTSLDTMQRSTNSPYGVTKAAIEAETVVWAQELAGTGVTMNSLIPGSAVNTSFVSERSRATLVARGRVLLNPEVMALPLLWLVSRESDGITGARFVAMNWDASLPPAEAAKKAREAPVLRIPDHPRPGH